MADYTGCSESEALNNTILSVMSRYRHVMPGLIDSFDGDTNLATVYGSIKMKKIVNQQVEYMKHPLVVRVPVSVPYSPEAGLCLTLPIRKKDDCLLLYSDRFLDDFVDNGSRGGDCAYPEMSGGNRLTSEVRMFSETDAICIPGLISIPTAIPNWNNDAIELRNKDRTAFISLGVDSNITIQTQGNVTVNATGNVDVTGAQIHLN